VLGYDEMRMQRRKRIVAPWVYAIVARCSSRSGTGDKQASGGSNGAAGAPGAASGGILV
jgi:hypothetical protein